MHSKRKTIIRSLSHPMNKAGFKIVKNYNRHSREAVQAMANLSNHFNNKYRLS